MWMHINVYEDIWVDINALETIWINTNWCKFIRDNMIEIKLENDDLFNNWIILDNNLL